MPCAPSIAHTRTRCAQRQRWPKSVFDGVDSKEARRWCAFYDSKVAEAEIELLRLTDGDRMKEPGDA